MSLETLHRDTSHDTVLEAIRNSILDSVYPPGAQLKQSVLAVQLGVSQGPVREALSRLVEEGLVENIPYRGMFVRQLTEKDVEEIYQVRAMIECLATRLALSRLKEERHLAALEALVARSIEAARSGDARVMVQADLTVHSYIVELSDNSRLIKIWHSLLAQSQYLLRSLYLLTMHTSADRLARNHHAILEALRTGESSEIETVIEQHMEFAKGMLLDHWSEVSQEWIRHGSPRVAM